MVLGFAAPAHAADRDRLLFHAEAPDGAVLASRGADEPFNPASVLKVGTSLWALERLGPGHRFVTTFSAGGPVDAAAGRLAGNLVVEGGGDPDFHPENAFLVARELNRLGVHRVDGALEIRGSFWMGWENGAAKQIADPAQRRRVMGERLRAALDPDRWDSHIAASWQAACGRHGWDLDVPPRVEVPGGIAAPGLAAAAPLVHHRSNPLPVLLKRFNTYSNNDIIRIAEVLGGAPALERYLRSRLDAPADLVEVSTASGEQRNRLTARLAVRLVRTFMAACAERGLAVDELLPVPGCDPGPTRRMFPRLASGPRQCTIVCKTGTLTTTDGGVSTLAGAFSSPLHGRVVFAVAVRQTGRELSRWRRLQQEWLLDLQDHAGGAIAVACRGELPFSDAFAEAVVAALGGS